MYLFVKKDCEKKKQKKRHSWAGAKSPNPGQNISELLSQPTLASFSYCSYSAIISIAMVTPVQLFCEAWDLNT